MLRLAVDSASYRQNETLTPRGVNYAIKLAKKIASGESYMNNSQQKSFLAGNSALFDLGTVKELTQSPLKGMNIAFLGSSVTKGHSSEGISFVEFIGKHNGCGYTKEGKGTLWKMKT